MDWPVPPTQAAGYSFVSGHCKHIAKTSCMLWYLWQTWMLNKPTSGVPI